MALYPPAVKRLIPPGPNDPRITPRVLILHVAVSEAASLYDYFNGPSGGIESHFYIRRDGTVEQYRDTAYQADANTDANGFAISVETQGMERGEWTDAQMGAIKALTLWCNDVHGIPLQVPTAWDGSGVGYHTLFPGVWDKRGASCPGPDRKAQFVNVLVPWMATGEEDDMQLTDKVKVTRADGKGTEEVPLSTLFNRMQFVYAEVIRQRATEAAQTAAIKALAEAKGADADAITAAVLAKIGELTVTLTPKES